MQLSEVDRRAIRQVIERQLEAFQRDDAAGAFAFASPGIQAEFETADRFLDMVRSCYEPVYRPRSVMFQELLRVEGYPAQKVVLMAPDGDLVTALYLMEPQPDGRWRIQGCFLIPIGSKLTHDED
jgi:hypothetical protein